MKALIMYKDGTTVEFDISTGHDALELDLNTEHGLSIFSIQVIINQRIAFSAYNWHNEPK